MAGHSKLDEIEVGISLVAIEGLQNCNTIVTSCEAIANFDYIT